MELARVFVPFALGYFVSFLYRVVNAVIAPDLIAALGLTAADLGLLTSAYFVSFGLFQLPLGVLLDRFGPRRTEAALLVFAAVGAFVFAAADSLVMLILGRALIGFGVSACLMAAFTAYRLWLPPSRLPLINGAQLAAGGLGAIAGTTPVEAVLTLTDWRGVFVGVGVATLILALVLFLVVPRRTERKASESWRETWRGTLGVYKSALFWRMVPLTVVTQSTWLAIQTLWTGPWLRDVAGLDRAAAADHLALIAAAMVGGFLVIGFAAERIGRVGVGPLSLAIGGMVAFFGLQSAIIALGDAAALWLWVPFGFLGTASYLTYTALAQVVPAALAGRAITALNVLVFFGAFAAQWTIGVVIDLWPAAADGAYAAEGYRAAFGLMLALQLLAFAWLLLYRRAPLPLKVRADAAGA